jgi:multidrug resistance protein, MATE family
MIRSYIEGITDSVHGESYYSIVRYFVPEFITTLVLYSLPFWIDSYFIGHLESTTQYAALGSTNNVLHLLIKIAESLAIGTVILAGYSNGIKHYEDAGRVMRDAFWTTVFLGTLFSGGLFLGASYIYAWYGVPLDVCVYAVPFLRLRAVGIFFTFIALAFIGFLRGIKNTRAPMKIFSFGALVFVITDYCLIFGKWGAPQLGLQGSAWASILQYATIALVAMSYVLFNKKYRVYAIDLFSIFSQPNQIRELSRVSWAVVIDKTIMAVAYIWLGKMIAPMGTRCVAAFCVIKDMERFAFLPAIACAQIITILASNDVSTQNWIGIKTNVKKIGFMASVLVLSILIVFFVHCDTIMYIFDRKGEFTEFAVQAFPIISSLVLCDLAQLILAGALRGAGNVKTVMMVRFAVCFGFFIPFSYLVSCAPLGNDLLKFIGIYGVFYIGNGLMSLAYMYRLRGTEWNKVSA